MRVSEAQVQEEAISFLRSKKFACSPFRKILLGTDHPEDHVTVLPADPHRTSDIFCRDCTKMKDGVRDGHVFVHPIKVRTEQGNIELARKLNLEAALGIQRLFGNEEDPATARVVMEEEMGLAAAMDQQYDFVKPASSIGNPGDSEFFSTYLSPHLSQEDTRYAPYPMIGVVATRAVARISDEVRQGIMMKTLGRNGPRGFSGKYFPWQGTTNLPQRSPS